MLEGGLAMNSLQSNKSQKSLQPESDIIVSHLPPYKPFQVGDVFCQIDQIGQDWF